jgi:hypothetical protein
VNVEVAEFDLAATGRELAERFGPDHDGECTAWWRRRAELPWRELADGSSPQWTWMGAIAYLLDRRVRAAQVLVLPTGQAPPGRRERPKCLSWRKG